MSALPQAGLTINAPPRAVRLSGQPDTYAPEKPTWGAIKAGPIRTWSQFLFLNSGTRADTVGAFCRRARGDRNFPEDPTRVIRYLVTQLAPRDVLEAARQTVAEYRAWHAEGLEYALREIMPQRADVVRESMRESLAALDRLYAADLAVLDAREGAA